MGRTVVSTELLMKPIAQFSFGMRAGDIVRIGATAGTDAARRLVGSSPGLVDVSAQTAQMLVNFEISLKLLGAAPADVVQIRTWLNDWRDRARFEAAVQERWPQVAACHSIVGSIGFPIPQAAVEAELVAIVGGSRTSLSSPRLGAAAAAGANAGVRAGARHFCTVGPADDALLSDPAVRARSCLDRLEVALDAAGRKVAELVMLNVNVGDLRLLPVFDRVFRERMRAPYPARTVTGTSLPDPRWLFSLDAIAIAGGGRPIGPDAGPAGAPASAAMLAGDELFIGGVLGSTAGAASTESVQDQTEDAWRRIDELLAAAGMTADDVLHTTNTLTDWRSYGAFNAAYGAHVSPPYPPRATVVAALAEEPARVMIEVHAHRGARDGRFIGFAPPASTASPAA
jgi:enamine deaminase RidA (YjgF/YER057c/UK114 family)